MKRSAAQSLMSQDWIGSGVVFLLVGLLGWWLYAGGPHRVLSRLSFDCPFAFKAAQKPEEAAIVYMDESSEQDLQQAKNAAWNRSLHARLINRLSEAGAKAIVFDILMTDPAVGPDSARQDEMLAQAIRASGRVILADNLNRNIDGKEWLEKPYEPFESVAAGWGNVSVIPDPDYGLRSQSPNTNGIFTLPWAAARFAGAPVTRLDPALSAKEWINYYGPPGSIDGVSYSQALQPDGVRPGFFKDRVVFVGAQKSADFLNAAKDEFNTPYALFGKIGYASGVEIHATVFVNLMRGDWLTQIPGWADVSLLLFMAAATGFGLLRLRPVFAMAVALVGLMAIIAAAVALQIYGRIWFMWLVLVLQLAFGLFCSIFYNSLKLYIEKRLVQASLAARLSAPVAEQLLKDESLRRPGGTRQEVSILFSDIANFSRVSESMNPDDLINLLNRYFGAAIEPIHETDGTVIDLIGDAIFAIWNAPVAQPDHRRRACLAGMKLHEQVVNFDATEQSLPLRTRVGLHSGTACVGNIGSKIRFNYTAISENINLASRLEGLNKHLGTNVLATRDIQKDVEDLIASRLIGHFKFKGFGRAAQVHELLGSLDTAASTRAWCDQFAAALQQFRQRNWDAAERSFREVIACRKAAGLGVSDTSTVYREDGPSSFYLARITEFRLHPPPDDWIGEVSLSEK